MTTATNYNSTEITVKGKKYTVTVATGKSSYILVSQNMPNMMRGSLGRQFSTFDEAVRSYKSPEMKTELLKVELGLI
jgi:hypothetical protein